MSSTLKNAIPRLPMLSVADTSAFYIDKLGFELNPASTADYLMLYRDEVELHFFLMHALSKQDNYGRCYIRVQDIEQLYQLVVYHELELTPQGKLETKAWGQKEFSVVDINGNQLTFGETIN